MSEIEKDVLRLCEKASKKKPITKAEIMDLVHIRERETRLVIGNLREKGFRVINDNRGYWLATPTEYKEWLPHYTAYARTILRRARKMDKYTENQLKIVLNKE